MSSETPPPGSGRPGDPSSAEEVERLQAEVEHLRTRVPADDTPAVTSRRRGWWRPVVVTVLITVAALIAPLSVLATWANDQVENTDRYVATVGPLASDPAVQDAIAARIEQVIFSYIDVQGATQDLVQALEATGLPPRVQTTLETVAGPLSSAVRNFISDKIQQFVQSDAFQQAWIDANRVAHSQLVAALTGNGSDSVQISKGEVTIQLATLINAIKNQLVASGFTLANRIPEVNATYTIVQSDDLSKVQTGIDLLDNLSGWLPAVGLLLIALAIVVARSRRRAILAAGLAVAGSMILLGAALNLLRPFYLDSLPADASQAAAGAVYDQVVSFIRQALRAVLVVGLVVAVVAWLMAPSGTGASARGMLTRGIAGTRRGLSRGGLSTGAFGVALATYRNAIRIGVVGVAALLYLLETHPTGGTALTFVVVTAVILLLLELLAADPARVAEKSEAAQPGAPPSP